MSEFPAQKVGQEKDRTLTAHAFQHFLSWLDEGTSFALPLGRDATGCARVRHFGNWLRLAADLPAGQRVEAEAVLRIVTGARAPLAGFWLVWLARPAA